jgi:two-component system, chemotaxis family, protein-glutamate methylesterase/glutaminase
MTGERKIRVLVVDDSLIVRRILTQTLAAEPDLIVVGAVPDPVAAREKLAEWKPDVITVDIEMPRMDGISFIRELTSTTPIPCIVISSVAQQGCARAIEALEAGAVEVLAKPAGPYSIGELKQSLAQKVRAASHARLRVRPASRCAPPPRASDPFAGTLPRSAVGAVIAIGASTGGTEAVREVLTCLPVMCPPVLVVQHIPPVFSRSFAERLDQCCDISVREARDGDRLQSGVALIAPGDQHMVLRRLSTGLQIRLNSGPRVCYQRPAVDVLFTSVAELPHLKALGAILTGMGNDGAAGLKRMRDSGARTIAQDEASSVVYGMPREAVRIGAAERVLPLHRIGEAIRAWCSATPDVHAAAAP